jgi:hypothetical protein
MKSERRLCKHTIASGAWWRFSRCENPARKAGGTNVAKRAFRPFAAVAETLRSATELSQRDNFHQCPQCL